MSDFEFKKPKINYEQYLSTLSIQSLYSETLSGLKGKTILDLGTGTGALIKAVDSVLFDCHYICVDIDPDAILQAEGNLKGLPVKFINRSINQLNDIKCDVIMTNPPFGVRDTQRYIDEKFMSYALRQDADLILFLCAESRFEKLLTMVNNDKKHFVLKTYTKVPFIIKKTYAMHKENAKSINVCFIVISHVSTLETILDKIRYNLSLISPGDITDDDLAQIGDSPAWVEVSPKITTFLNIYFSCSFFIELEEDNNGSLEVLITASEKNGKGFENESIFRLTRETIEKIRKHIREFTCTINIHPNIFPKMNKLAISELMPEGFRGELCYCVPEIIFQKISPFIVVFALANLIGKSGGTIIYRTLDSYANFDELVDKTLKRLVHMSGWKNLGYAEKLKTILSEFFQLEYSIIDDLKRLDIDSQLILKDSEITQSSLEDFGEGLIQIMKEQNERYNNYSEEEDNKLLVTLVNNIQSLDRDLDDLMIEFKSGNLSSDGLNNKTDKIYKKQDELVRNYLIKDGIVKTISTTGNVGQLKGISLLITFLVKKMIPLQHKEVLSEQDKIRLKCLESSQEMLSKLNSLKNKVPAFLILQNAQSKMMELKDDLPFEAQSDFQLLYNRMCESGTHRDIWSYALRLKGLIYEAYFASNFKLKFINEDMKPTLVQIIAKHFPSQLSLFLDRTDNCDYVRNLTPDFYIPLPKETYSENLINVREDVEIEDSYTEEIKPESELSSEPNYSGKIMSRDVRFMEGMPTYLGFKKALSNRLEINHNSRGFYLNYKSEMSQCIEIKNEMLRDSHRIRLLEAEKKLKEMKGNVDKRNEKSVADIIKESKSDFTIMPEDLERDKIREYMDVQDIKLIEPYNIVEDSEDVKLRVDGQLHDRSTWGVLKDDLDTKKIDHKEESIGKLIIIEVGFQTAIEGKLSHDINKWMIPKQILKTLQIDTDLLICADTTNLNDSCWWINTKNVAMIRKTISRLFYELSVNTPEDITDALVADIATKELRFRLRTGTSISTPVLKTDLCEYFEKRVEHIRDRPTGTRIPKEVLYEFEQSMVHGYVLNQSSVSEITNMLLDNSEEIIKQVEETPVAFDMLERKETLNRFLLGWTNEELSKLIHSDCRGNKVSVVQEGSKLTHNFQILSMGSCNCMNCIKTHGLRKLISEERLNLRGYIMSIVPKGKYLHSEVKGKTYLDYSTVRTYNESELLEKNKSDLDKVLHMTLPYKDEHDKKVKRAVMTICQISMKYSGLAGIKDKKGQIYINKELIKEYSSLKSTNLLSSTQSTADVRRFESKGNEQLRFELEKAVKRVKGSRHLSDFNSDLINKLILNIDKQQSTLSALKSEWIMSVLSILKAAKSPDEMLESIIGTMRDKKDANIYEDRFKTFSVESVRSYMDPLLKEVNFKTEGTVFSPDCIIMPEIFDSIKEQFKNSMYDIIPGFIDKILKLFCKNTWFNHLVLMSKVCAIGLNAVSEFNQSGFKIFKVNHVNLNVALKIPQKKTTGVSVVLLDSNFQPLPNYSKPIYLSRGQMALIQSYPFCLLMMYCQCLQNNSALEYFVREESFDKDFESINKTIIDLGTNLIDTMCEVTSGLNIGNTSQNKIDNTLIDIKEYNSKNKFIMITSSFCVNFALIYDNPMLLNSQTMNKFIQTIRYPYMMALSNYAIPYSLGAKMSTNVRRIEHFVLRSFFLHVCSLALYDPHYNREGWKRDSSHPSTNIPSLTLYPVKMVNSRQFTFDIYIVHLFNKDENQFEEGTIRILDELGGKHFEWETDLKKSIDNSREIKSAIKDAESCLEDRVDTSGRPLTDKTEKMLIKIKSKKQRQLNNKYDEMRLLMGVPEVDKKTKAYLSREGLVSGVYKDKPESDDGSYCLSTSSSQGSMVSSIKSEQLKKLEVNIQKEQNQEKMWKEKLRTSDATNIRTTTVRSLISDRTESSIVQTKPISAGLIKKISISGRSEADFKFNSLSYKPTMSRMKKVTLECIKKCSNYSYASYEMVQCSAGFSKKVFNKAAISAARRDKRNWTSLSSVSETTSIIRNPIRKFDVKNTIDLIIKGESKKISKLLSASLLNKVNEKKNSQAESDFEVAAMEKFIPKDFLCMVDTDLIKRMVDQKGKSIEFQSYKDLEKLDVESSLLSSNGYTPFNWVKSIKTKAATYLQMKSSDPPTEVPKTREQLFNNLIRLYKSACKCTEVFIYKFNTTLNREDSEICTKKIISSKTGLSWKFDPFKVSTSEANNVMSLFSHLWLGSICLAIDLKSELSNYISYNVVITDGKEHEDFIKEYVVLIFEGMEMLKENEKLIEKDMATILNGLEVFRSQIHLKSNSIDTDMITEYDTLLKKTADLSQKRESANKVSFKRERVDLTNSEIEFTKAFGENLNKTNSMMLMVMMYCPWLKSLNQQEMQVISSELDGQFGYEQVKSNQILSFKDDNEPKNVFYKILGLDTIVNLQSPKEVEIARYVAIMFEANGYPFMHLESSFEPSVNTSMSQVANSVTDMVAKLSFLDKTVMSYNWSICHVRSGNYIVCSKAMTIKGKDRVPRSDRSKVIYEIIKASKEYGSMNLQEIAFRAILDYQHNLFFTMAPKAQLGGDRDLLIQEVKTKFINGVSEAFAKSILATIDNDGLTNPNVKEMILNKSSEEKKRAFDVDGTEYKLKKSSMIGKVDVDPSVEWRNLRICISIAGDNTKWGPKHITTIFSAMLQQILYDTDDSWCNYEMLVMLKNVSKEIEIPIASIEKIIKSFIMSDGFKTYTELSLKDKSLSEVIKEFGSKWEWKPFVQYLIESYLSKGEMTLKCFNHMGQGIHHATSSLLQNITTRFIDYLMTIRFDRSISGVNMNIDSCGSSDDFSKVIVISGVVPSSDYLRTKEKVMIELKNTLNFMSGIMLVNQMKISDKSIVSDTVNEYNSEFDCFHNISPSSQKYTISPLISSSVSSPLTLYQACLVSSQQAMYNSVGMLSINMMVLLKQMVHIQHVEFFIKSYGPLTLNSLSPFGLLFTAKYSELCSSSPETTDLKQVLQSIEVILKYIGLISNESEKKEMMKHYKMISEDKSTQEHSLRNLPKVTDSEKLSLMLEGVTQTFGKIFISEKSALEKEMEMYNESDYSSHSSEHEMQESKPIRDDGLSSTGSSSGSNSPPVMKQNESIESIIETNYESMLASYKSNRSKCKEYIELSDDFKNKIINFIPKVKVIKFLTNQHWSRITYDDKSRESNIFFIIEKLVSSIFNLFVFQNYRDLDSVDTEMNFRAMTSKNQTTILCDPFIQILSDRIVNVLKKLRVEQESLDVNNLIFDGVDELKELISKSLIESNNSTEDYASELQRLGQAINTPSILRGLSGGDRHLSIPIYRTMLRSHLFSQKTDLILNDYWTNSISTTNIISGNSKKIDGKHRVKYASFINEFLRQITIIKNTEDYNLSPLKSKENFTFYYQDPYFKVEYVEIPHKMRLIMKERVQALEDYQSKGDIESGEVKELMSFIQKDRNIIPEWKVQNRSNVLFNILNLKILDLFKRDLEKMIITITDPIKSKFLNIERSEVHHFTPIENLTIKKRKTWTSSRTTHYDNNPSVMLAYYLSPIQTSTMRVKNMKYPNLNKDLAYFINDYSDMFNLITNIVDNTNIKNVKYNINSLNRLLRSLSSQMRGMPEFYCMLPVSEKYVESLEALPRFNMIENYRLDFNISAAESLSSNTIYYLILQCLSTLNNLMIPDEKKTEMAINFMQWRPSSTTDSTIDHSICDLSDYEELVKKFFGTTSIKMKLTSELDSIRSQEKRKQISSLITFFTSPNLLIKGNIRPENSNVPTFTGKPFTNGRFTINSTEGMASGSFIKSDLYITCSNTKPNLIQIIMEDVNAWCFQTKNENLSETYVMNFLSLLPTYNVDEVPSNLDLVSLKYNELTLTKISASRHIESGDKYIIVDKALLPPRRATSEYCDNSAFLRWTRSGILINTRSQIASVLSITQYKILYTELQQFMNEESLKRLDPKNARESEVTELGFVELPQTFGKECIAIMHLFYNHLKTADYLSKNDMKSKKEYILQSAVKQPSFITQDCSLIEGLQLATDEIKDKRRKVLSNKQNIYNNNWLVNIEQIEQIEEVFNSKFKSITDVKVIEKALEILQIPRACAELVDYKRGVVSWDLNKYKVKSSNVIEPKDFMEFLNSMDQNQFKSLWSILPLLPNGINTLFKKVKIILNQLSSVKLKDYEMNLIFTMILSIFFDDDPSNIWVKEEFFAFVKFNEEALLSSREETKIINTHLIQFKRIIINYEITDNIDNVIRADFRLREPTLHQLYGDLPYSILSEDETSDNKKNKSLRKWRRFYCREVIRQLFGDQILNADTFEKLGFSTYSYDSSEKNFKIIIPLDLDMYCLNMGFNSFLMRVFKMPQDVSLRVFNSICGFLLNFFPLKNQYMPLKKDIQDFFDKLLNPSMAQMNQSRPGTSGFIKGRNLVEFRLDDIFEDSDEEESIITALPQNLVLETEDVEKTIVEEDVPDMDFSRMWDEEEEYD